MNRDNFVRFLIGHELMAQSFSVLTIVKSFEKDFCGLSGCPIYFQNIQE